VFRFSTFVCAQHLLLIIYAARFIFSTAHVFVKINDNLERSVQLLSATAACDAKIVEIVQSIDSLIQTIVEVEIEDDDDKGKISAAACSDPFSISSFMPCSDLKRSIQADAFESVQQAEKSRIARQRRIYAQNVPRCGNVQLLLSLGKYGMFVVRRRKQHSIAQMCLNDLYTQCELLKAVAKRRFVIENTKPSILGLLQELHGNIQKYPAAKQWFTTDHALQKMMDSFCTETQENSAEKALKNQLFTAFLMPMYHQIFDQLQQHK